MLFGKRYSRTVVVSDYYYDYIPEVSSFVAVVGVGADIFDAQARRAGLLHFFYFWRSLT